MQRMLIHKNIQIQVKKLKATKRGAINQAQ